MMSGNGSVDIKTTADLLENEKTDQRKKDAAKIEQQQKEAAEKAREAQEEAKRKEQERLEKELAAKKAKEEQLAREAEAAKEAEAARLAAAKQKEELIGAGLALAGTALAGAGGGGKKSFGSFLKGLLLGIVIGAIGFWFLMPRPAAPAPAPTPVPIEDAEVTIDNDGVLGYTAADFQNAVLGAATEHQELIVMEQPLSISTTITKAGLGNFPIFSKMKDVTYYGTGVYTVDLSGMDNDRIIVDEDTYTVTIRIPHAVLQYVNPELASMEFEYTEKGFLAFGDIKLTAEETNQLETSVYDAMRERLDSQDLYDEADRFAKLKTWEIFQPLVTAVSPMFKVETDFID